MQELPSLEQRLLSSRGARACHCGVFSCGGVQALDHMGSVVLAHGLSCPMACGILLTGIEHMSPALASRFLTIGPPGKSTVNCSVAQACPPLQHARLPCPSPAPGACSNSCPLMPSHHLIFYYPLLLLPSIFKKIRAFSYESVLCIR